MRACVWMCLHTLYGIFAAPRLISYRTTYKQYNPYDRLHMHSSIFCIQLAKTLFIYWSLLFKNFVLISSCLFQRALFQLLFLHIIIISTCSSITTNINDYIGIPRVNQVVLKFDYIRLGFPTYVKQKIFLWRTQVNKCCLNVEDNVGSNIWYICHVLRSDSCSEVHNNYTNKEHRLKQRISQACPTHVVKPSHKVYSTTFQKFLRS